MHGEKAKPDAKAESHLQESLKKVVRVKGTYTLTKEAKLDHRNSVANDRMREWQTKVSK